ncbi:hypothetical protein BT93_L0986 [Corymbia citriodora subsp. variegata]|uniref:Transcription factor CBF/NF-Y/archaeal histone domain-containing protein n=1 Tax=Corymbia citriodora subsp. variegata TaxID=360336 RepID=A0A8T0CGA5_CORYI|nr:hypothetical protein BT93_L0986 [Corymbia citriodora subsp. variegata]
MPRKSTAIEDAEQPIPDAPSSPKPPVSKKAKKSVQTDDLPTLETLLLPRSLIQRLARGALPPNTALQKDALTAISKSATVFVSMVAGVAAELTDKKTIQAEDVMRALGECEFGGMVERVKRETEVWEEEVRVKRRGWKDNQKERERAAKAEGGEKSTIVAGNGSMVEDTIPLEETVVDNEEEDDSVEEVENESEEDEGANVQLREDNGVGVEGDDSRSDRHKIMAPGGAVDVGSDEDEED